MAHFYGALQGNRGETTRYGTASSGIQGVLASWNGCIEVTLRHDSDADEDFYEIRSCKWKGRGHDHLIARGIVGGRPPREGEQLPLFEGIAL